MILDYQFCSGEQLEETILLAEKVALIRVGGISDLAEIAEEYSFIMAPDFVKTSSSRIQNLFLMLRSSFKYSSL